MASFPAAEITTNDYELLASRLLLLLSPNKCESPTHLCSWLDWEQQPYNTNGWTAFLVEKMFLQPMCWSILKCLRKCIYILPLQLDIWSMPPHANAKGGFHLWRPPNFSIIWPHPPFSVRKSHCFLGSLRWRWLIFSLARGRIRVAAARLSVVHQQILPEMSVCRLSGQLPAAPPNQYFDPGPMPYCVDIIYGRPLKQRGVEPSIIHSYGASERTGAMPGRRGDQQHEAHRAN